MSITLRFLLPVTVLVSLLGGVASGATQPRPEYPRPDLVRAEWLNLNGEWDFTLDRYKKLTEALLTNPAVAGFCYTQLYDVEQEVNGLLTFDRRPKHDVEYFRKINQRTAAIERSSGRVRGAK